MTRFWTRLVVVLTVILGLNYVAWRWASSLNWDAWWIAAPLVVAETYSLIDVMLFGMTVWQLKIRKGAPAPPHDATVDVFITTYNEDLSYDTIGKDISCNLGSMNIALSMDSPDFGKTVETAIRGLNSVSEQSHIASVRSIEDGNDKSHAIGLGQMNLHGYLARERSAAEVIVLGLPDLLHSHDRRCRQSRAVKAQARQRFGEVAGGNPLEVQPGDQLLDRLALPQIRTSVSSVEPRKNL